MNNIIFSIVFSPIIYIYYYTRKFKYSNISSKKIKDQTNNNVKNKSYYIKNIMKDLYVIIYIEYLIFLHII